ncbi:MAG: hypothetical protein JOY69_07315 [Candidatus Eremiobacteraeota bacterium]|nr:hypothetical protein [Candidatus Eremiobacteraeota bacterium]
MNRWFGSNGVASAFVAAILLNGCAGGGISGASSQGGAPFAPSAPSHRAHAAVGLGKVLTTKDGGQIFGFDIDQNGNDGVLASAKDTSKPGVYKVSVETFDQNSGQITKSFASSTGTKNSYGVDGIFAGDVALVTHFTVPKGKLFANRTYETMNPVTQEQFTGKWTPPIKDVNVEQGAENQATSTSVLFAIELKNQDKPDLFVSNIAANTFSNVIHLDPNLFGGADGPQLGQYTAANEAVFALSPDGGRVGGEAPVNVLIDLATGKSTQFTGYNSGPFGAGYVNGMAVDPNTGIEATTTELNAQVEFYDVNKKTGITNVQLPCTGNASQGASGSGVAVDPVNKLFFVNEQTYCNGSQGSAIVIYDEAGNLVETITGFNFVIAEPAAVLNPSKRMGWAFGPQFSQLQQFFY